LKEFARQVLREASELLREGGIADFERHDTNRPEFPLYAFLRLHGIVTGEKRPTTLVGELEHLKAIVSETPN
jgi:hypothetical protein